MDRLAKVQRKRVAQQRIWVWVETKKVEVKALVNEYEKKFIEQAIANQIAQILATWEKIDLLVSTTEGMFNKKDLSLTLRIEVRLGMSASAKFF